MPWPVSAPFLRLIFPAVANAQTCVATLASLQVRAARGGRSGVYHTLSYILVPPGRFGGAPGGLLEAAGGLRKLPDVKTEENLGFPWFSFGFPGMGPWGSRAHFPDFPDWPEMWSARR